MSLPKEINGFTKCQIKHDRNCISLRYLMKKKDEDVCIAWRECRLYTSPGNADILNLKL
jgi:hypothetical protein